MDLLSILDGTPEPPIVQFHHKPNTLGEYILATPMFEFQKELTDQIVSLHYPDILKACTSAPPSALLETALQTCIENCLLVATHPYLLIRHYMPRNLAAKELPAKLAETSGKFAVLRDLAAVLTTSQAGGSLKHVAILVKNDSRTFDLIEALLCGSAGPRAIVRHVGSSIRKDLSKTARAALKDAPNTTFHLVPSDGQTAPKDASINDKHVRFDVLVALDSSTNLQSEHVQEWRRQNRMKDEHPAVLIRLVPMLSVEHSLVTESLLPPPENALFRLVASVVCLRDILGNLPPDLAPVYRQNLAYLSPFFDEALRHGNPQYPPWPLPEPGRLPRFLPEDVERSLLTEVVYHYTPYDSAELADTAPKRKSYYESRRLQLAYVTNPLHNDYRTLSGIHPHHAQSKVSGSEFHLTHLLVSQLNTNYTDLARLKEEYASFRAHDAPSRMDLCVRRLEDTKKTLALIMEDVDHAEQRIQVTLKKTAKRTHENSLLEETQDLLKAEITKLRETLGLEKDALRSAFIARQLKIWDLQNEVKALASSLAARRDESGYMATEAANCANAMEKDSVQIELLRLTVAEWHKKLNSLEKEEMRSGQEFRQQRRAVLERVAAAEKENASARDRLGRTWAYLKGTSHLKKRKGRGVTPGAR